MDFFKKIFGSKENKDPIQQSKSENLLDSYKNIAWMTNDRLESISICLNAGFRPARSLPTEFDRQMRPAIEIACRLNAIKALVLWLLVPEEELASERILNFVSKNRLEQFITEKEKEILNSSRDDYKFLDSIGWKFENAWPLAWYFGYLEPEITGQMMTGEQIRAVFSNYTCPLDENVENWVKSKEVVSEESIIKKEDLFYCLHNAVRSAQCGEHTVPPNFDPIGNGGVIHERRHSLTWMLSKGIEWDDTDLST